jgi:beta-N-acetylglucosaminidase
MYLCLIYSSPMNNVVANNRLNISEKYINFCDLEYMADLEDEQANRDGNINNTLLIKRCKDFREMVYKDTINMFHDSKDILTKIKTKNSNEKIIELQQ